MTPLSIAEYLIPAISVGFILAATGVFIFLALRGGQNLHRAMVLNGLLAFGFVGSEVLILTFGSTLGNLPLSREFHRLEQVCGAIFIYSLPLLMGVAIQLRPVPKKVHRVVVSFAGVAAGALALIAFLYPPLFIDTDHPRASVVFQMDVGRGLEGPAYLIRDLLVGGSMIYALILGILHVKDQARKRYVIPILIGLCFGFFMAADDILMAQTGRYLTHIPFTFSRVSLGFTGLLLTFMAVTLLRYLDQERELRRAYHSLHQMAYHDSLTGLPNRKALLERLNETLAQAKRSEKEPLRAIVIFDLYHFRIINDTWGTDTGDAVLEETGRRLRAALRQGDILARTGHDEFTAVLTHLAREDGAGLATVKLLAGLATPYAPYGKDLHLAANAGIAVYPRDGVDTDTLFRRAELALAQARREDLPFRYYTERLQEDILQRMRLAERIRTALEREEFSLDWQPQVDPSGRIVGAEALVRWRTGDRQIPPSEFIPVAEETRLILPLGDYILRKALTQEHLWRRMGFHLDRVAINLSPRQLAVDSLVADVMRFLNETQADPNHVELEITESGVMEDPDGVRAKIVRLQELGIKFAIDDFGTGYSSLAYLQRFPAQVLKIDQAFVRGMQPGNLDSRLVDGIISLAGTFNMETCAEGVETAEQAESLKAAGCTRLQGYYFGKPVSAEAFTELLKKQG